MVAGMKKFQAGHYEQRLSVPSNDEIGQIAYAFNDMAGRVEESVEAMERKNRELDDAYQELRRSHEELGHFAYIATHDLQEPLRAIGSFTDLIERELGQEATPKLQRYAAFVRDGVKRMDAQFKGLMAYALIDRDSPTYEPVDLTAAARTAAEEVRRDHAPEAHIRVEPLPEARGTSAQFHTLFDHLISNAVRFAHPQRTPEVVVHAEPGAGTEWIVSVSDNGIGIEPRYFDRLFLLFRRLEPGHHPEGRGIGLAVCRRIVERHGGRIWVESDPGAGTTFRFTVPAATGAPAPTTNPAPATKDESER